MTGRLHPFAGRRTRTRETVVAGARLRHDGRMPTLLLLTLSNVFMTIAWYWHLKGGPEVANARPLGWVILISWLLAGVEYSLAVPANRIGYAGGWSAGQLKIAQEAIALTVFGLFMVFVLGEALSWRHLAAFACIMAAAAFLFVGR
jgi:uncharacterized protein (DUF486 family)